MQRLANRMLATAAVLAALCSAAGAQQLKYTIKDLGVLPGHSNSRAFGVNNAGLVVGDSYDSVNNQRRAFVFEKGVMKDLGTLPGGQFSWAFGVNDHGQIAGRSDTKANNLTYTAATFMDLPVAGPLTGMPTLAGFHSRANAINLSRHMAGTTVHAAGEPYTATVWQPFHLGTGTLVHKLGGLMPNGGSEAFGISDSGLVVGKAQIFDGFGFYDHAFLWEAGTMTDLGTFGSASAFSTAEDVNDQRVVVGYSMGLANPTRIHAFRWKDGVMTDLGTLLPGWNSRAFGINAAGTIVGSATAALTDHAVLWDGKGLHDLNQLVIPPSHGWTLIEARGISNTGYIVGVGHPPGSLEQHAYLLRPLRFELQGVRLLSFPPLAGIL